uniref:Alpha-carbonic anhydrase domain-containing protein n=3 Tax=Glycine subgen. Soja TaxID=1462606 RepID=A0A368UIJ9_SOYBN
MERAMAIQLFAYSFFIVIVLLFPPAMCAEFNYDLSSPNGPLNWGNNPQWQLCKNGKNQSPINLQKLSADVEFISGIQRNYQPANATLISSEHDIMIEDDLQLMAENQTRTRALGIVDPEDVAGITGQKYFRYNGSLTVPPCSEDVLWTVFIKEGRTASREQIKLLRAAVNGAGDETFENARPIQPRNGRPVKLYKDREGKLKHTAHV